MDDLVLYLLNLRSLAQKCFDAALHWSSRLYSSSRCLTLSSGPLCGKFTVTSQNWKRDGNYSVAGNVVGVQLSMTGITGYRACTRKTRFISWMFESTSTSVRWCDAKTKARSLCSPLYSDLVSPFLDLNSVNASGLASSRRRTCASGKIALREWSIK